MGIGAAPHTADATRLSQPAVSVTRRGQGSDDTGLAQILCPAPGYLSVIRVPREAAFAIKLCSRTKSRSSPGYVSPGVPWPDLHGAQRSENCKIWSKHEIHFTVINRSIVAYVHEHRHTCLHHTLVPLKRKFWDFGGQLIDHLNLSSWLSILEIFFHLVDPRQEAKREAIDRIWISQCNAVIRTTQCLSHTGHAVSTPLTAGPGIFMVHAAGEWQCSPHLASDASNLFSVLTGTR